MLYQPAPNAKPISRHRIRCNRGRIIDSYTEQGELIHIYRTPDGQHYSGPADVRKHEAAYKLVTLIA